MAAPCCCVIMAMIKLGYGKAEFEKEWQIMNKSKNEIPKETYSYVSTDGSGTGMVIVPLAEAYKPKETEELNGVVYKRVDELRVDVNQIPDHVRDLLAAATLEAVKEWMKDPETRKQIDERTAKRKAR